MGVGIGITVCQRRDNRSNEIPWDLAPGAAEVAGVVLVSRSPTLSSAHVHTVGRIRQLMNFPPGPKKRVMELFILSKLTCCQYSICHSGYRVYL